jgi:hypothetical protein
VTLLLVVRLDDAAKGAGPATVLARVTSVAEYLATVPRDKDGGVDRRCRLWRGDLEVGARVVILELGGLLRTAREPSTGARHEGCAESSCAACEVLTLCSRCRANQKEG